MKRDLAGIDADMFTPIGRVLQQAMAHGITNDMIYGGLVTGQTSLQNLWTANTTKNCIIGTRRVTSEGDVYRYMLANGTLDHDFGCEHLYPQEVGYSSVQAASAIGDTTMTITVGGSAGVAEDGNIAVNELAQGTLLIFKSGGDSFTRTIISNTAVSGGGTMTVTVKDAFHIALTTSDSGECMSNPWSEVTTGGRLDRCIIAIPNIALVDAEHGWGQTWGICWTNPQADVGSGNDKQQLVFRHDGSIETHDADSATTKQKQHAGFVLSWSGAADPSSQGAPFIMLQICMQFVACN